MGRTGSPATSVTSYKRTLCASQRRDVWNVSHRSEHLGLRTRTSWWRTGGSQQVGTPDSQSELAPYTWYIVLRQSSGRHVQHQLQAAASGISAFPVQCAKRLPTALAACYSVCKAAQCSLLRCQLHSLPAQRHPWASQSSASHRRGSGSIPDRSMWYNGTGTDVSPCTSVFPCHYHSTNALCSSSSACFSYQKGKREKPGNLPKLGKHSIENYCHFLT